MAQNVIVPVIDLTAAAQAATVPQYLQTAQAYGSQTAFDLTSGSTTIISGTGFYRVTACVSAFASSANEGSVSLLLTDGASPKQIYEYTYRTQTSGTEEGSTDFFDQVFFFAAGESFVCTITNQGRFIGSSRQVADINGTLVQPSGFTPQ